MEPHRHHLGATQTNKNGDTTLNLTWENMYPKLDGKGKYINKV